jgi:hypothetical protein
MRETRASSNWMESKLFTCIVQAGSNLFQNPTIAQHFQRLDLIDVNHGFAK